MAVWKTDKAISYHICLHKSQRISEENQLQYEVSKYINLDQNV